MRVLVYPHDLNMGGSQTNAIELAAQMRDLDVEPVIFGRPGTLNARIRELGLEFIESPNPGRRPSLRIARLLRTLAAERKIDVLHGYEWPPSLECVAAALGPTRTVAVSTVMSMSVPTFLPTSMPLVVGTEQLAAGARTDGRPRTQVLEPPVDLVHNQPRPAAEVASFRRCWGLDEHRPILVCVSRLADQLKAEGLFSAMKAVSGPLADLRIQLVIVGDGPAREPLAAAAAMANSRVPGSVVMTSELADPRAAYTSADVVLGMGGSALRSLAFGKPLVVQGEGGFFRLLEAESWPLFAWQGWYGVGQDARDGTAHLSRILRDLLVDGPRLDRLGAYGRDLVIERFSLVSAARRQLAIYQQAIDAPARPAETTASLTRSGYGLASYVVKRKLGRRRGDRPTDDFNARPLAAHGPPPPGASGSDLAGARSAVVYMAGAPWHAVPGTDVHLATALGRRRPVIWVDPPESILGRFRGGPHVPTISEVAPGVTRLHAVAPPGVTRPVIRTLARWWTQLLVRRHVARREGRGVGAVVVSSPEPLLAPWRHHDLHRVYFATDDFVAGAALMGMSERYIADARVSNIGAADTVLAVTETLVEELSHPAAGGRDCDRADRRSGVLMNGCDTQLYAGLERVEPAAQIRLTGPIAGVVGQFNDRLDLGCLEAVADAGVSLLLIGPRIDRDERFTDRFDRLIRRPTVQWVDRRPLAELPSFMTAIDVGLTPYQNTDFNRSSFPLKTLEYLTAGRPVVSTDLPAVRALDAEFVTVVRSSAEFATAVQRLLLQGPDPAAASARRAYAEAHSWSSRAAQLDRFIGLADPVAVP